VPNHATCTWSRLAWPRSSSPSSIPSNPCTTARSKPPARCSSPNRRHLCHSERSEESAPILNSVFCILCSEFVTFRKPAPLLALVSGQLQFAQFGGGAAMSSAVNGSDLVILGIVVPVDQFVIYGGPDIKTPADLKGKKLGVVAGGGSEDNIAMRAGIRYLGMDP